jgi:hypothetical protein
MCDAQKPRRLSGRLSRRNGDSSEVLKGGASQEQQMSTYSASLLVLVLAAICLLFSVGIVIAHLIAFASAGAAAWLEIKDGT